MPLRFLRILKRLIGGEVVNDALFRDIVLTHNVHGVYVFSLHVPKDCSSVVLENSNMACKKFPSSHA